MKMIRSTRTTSTSGVTFIAGSTTFFFPPAPRLIATRSAPRVCWRRLVASGRSRCCACVRRRCLRGGAVGRSSFRGRRGVRSGGVRGIRGGRFLPTGVVGGGARAVLRLLAHHEVETGEPDLLRPCHELADLSVLEPGVGAQHQPTIDRKSV